MAQEFGQSRADFAALLRRRLPQVYNISQPVPLYEDEVEEDAEVDLPAFHQAIANNIPNSQFNFDVYPLPPTVITNDTDVLNQRFEAIALGAAIQPAKRPVIRPLPPIVPPSTTFNNNVPIVILGEEQWLEVAHLLDEFSDEVVINRGDFRITKKAMFKLTPGIWLNDDLIDIYLQMVERRSLSVYGLRVKALETFFYTGLCSRSFNRERTSRNLSKIDIFACDLLVIPVHLSTHWCVAIVNFNDRRLRYYDSMAKVNDGLWAKNRDPVAKIRDFLDFHHQAVKGCPLPELKLAFPTNIPQQDNFDDCGMFLLKIGRAHV